MGPAVGASAGSKSAGSNEASLIDAVKAGNAQEVRALVGRRTDVNARELDGTSALHWAVRAHGANVHVKENVFGDTALMLAAAENHAEACQLLIGAGADVKARTNAFEPQRYSLSNSFSGKFTALLYAARQGSIEAARVL